MKEIRAICFFTLLCLGVSAQISPVINHVKPGIYTTEMSLIIEEPKLFDNELIADYFDKSVVIDWKKIAPSGLSLSNR